MKLVGKKDKRLYEVSEDILKEDIKGNSELFESMIKIMNENRGIGIAAPQVGVNKNVFIVKNSDLIDKVCINPEINESSNIERLLAEGCISFPGLSMYVKRAVWIDVSYLNESGEEISERLTGVEAQCFQHELDHLNGITFDQRVSPFVYRRALEKLNKRVRKFKRRMK